jgi:hypothetical protein
MAKLTQILILGPQALHLTLALRTALGLGLAQAASDKVLAASISSTLISMLEAYFWWLEFKAHERCVSVEATMCKNKPNASVTDLAINRSKFRPLADNPFNFWGKVLDCGDIPVTS